MDNIPSVTAQLIEALGDEIDDVDEETFDLFSHTPSSQDLGMVDARAEDLEISIAGRDFTIKQSPGILQSNRDGGTTGAAVWRASVHVAEWFASSKNYLFETGVLGSSSIVLELGSGISGLIPLVLRPKVQRVVATDQQYSLKLLKQNIKTNTPPQKSTHHRSTTATSANLDIHALDWETDSIPSFLKTNNLHTTGIDAMVICDCVFNYALISPLIQTCREICQVRRTSNTDSDTDVEGSVSLLPAQPTLSIIAQQLRQPDVFEEWLRAFLESFRVWRIPDVMLSEGLRQGGGYVVHIGILR